MSDWKTQTLREAGVALIDCLHKTPAKADSGLPYVAIPQMKTGRIDLTDARLISPEDFDTWTEKASPRAHDVLLSRRCNPGVTAPVPDGLAFAVGQNLVLLRADGSHVYPPYLRWLAQSPAWWTEIKRFINVGAVFDSLRCADVPKFELPIPPVAEQRRIDAILGALDDKIELNRKMNRTLEEIAQAIFKSWFIDFDGVPPEDLVDSDIGPIPKGWRVASLKEVADHIRDTVQPASLDGDIPYVGLEHVPRRCATLETWGRASDVTSAKTRFEVGDVLFGKLRPYFHKVVPAPCSGISSTDILVIRAKSKPWGPFLFGHLFSDPLVAHASAATDGTKMPRTKWADLCRFPVAMPLDETAARFEAVATPVVKRMFANMRESRILADLRDTLLPKLISGELRVPQAEEALEATA